MKSVRHSSITNFTLSSMMQPYINTRQLIVKFSKIIKNTLLSIFILFEKLTANGLGKLFPARNLIYD